MKKSTLLLSMLALGSLAMGQTQRLVLAEEFTQASCGPCASQNPAFNALLSANTNKVVSIKYQTSWPGVDPMNAQNPSDVATRVSYYGVSGVPDSPMDGVEQTGSAYTGAPANYTQAKIDAEYAVPSPFTMSLSHMMSADYDSVYITCVITAAQNFTTAGPLKAHLAIVEETITFATAPGTNGETEFYNVMRKMLPSAAGTTLATSWTTGQTQTITIGAAIPSYVYSKSQIGIVGFIQSDNDKAVHQAAYSIPQMVSVDMGATALSGVPLYQCATTFTPTVTIKNFGSTTLTSATINYQVDAGTVMTQPWTGSLASGATTTVTLPAVTATTGMHTFKSYTSNPNGGTDFDGANNMTTQNFTIIGAAAAAPLVEGFTATTFPPAGWFINNAGGPTWTRKTGAGGMAASTACAKMDFYNSPAGEVDEFYAMNVDLSSGSSASMTFNVAYAQYTSENDKLEVKVSTNCGSTWTTVFNKQGSGLMTSAATTSAFTPTTAAQWRAESINLNSYAGQSNVMIKFVATSAYGNNLYVDDINIANAPVGVAEEAAAVSTMNVYPNPVTTTATVDFTLQNNEDVTIVVMNSVGQIVISENLGNVTSGAHQFVLNTDALSNGMYFVNINAGAHTSTQKISVSK